MAQAQVVTGESSSAPRSVEAEQSVLGGLLLDNQAFDVVADLLQRDHFYTQDHQLIFGAIATLVGRGQPADQLTVAEELLGQGKLEAVGGHAYIGSLALNTPSVANIRRYAEVVRERATSRALLSFSHELSRSVTEPAGRTVSEIRDWAEARVMAIGESARHGQQDFERAGDVIMKVTEFVDEQHQRRKDGGGVDLIGVPTGFVDLDKSTLGLQPGDFIILAGRPSMGKTSLSLNIAENAARDTDQWCQYYTLEMRTFQQGIRLLGSVAKVHTQRLVTGRVSAEEWSDISHARGALQDLKILFSEAGGASISEIRSFARRGVRQYGRPRLIVVDYIQLMLAGENESNRANQLAEISRGLKRLAQELETPVMALSQLNRAVEQRHNKRPMMSDLRESGALEQDADVILFIYRDEVYNPDTQHKGRAEIIIGKQRNGPTGTIYLTFRGDFTRFDNYADPIYGG